MVAALLGCTMDELGARMSAREFALWEIAVQTGMIGEIGSWMRSGTVAAAVANYAGKMRAETAPPATALDYLPDALVGRASLPAGSCMASLPAGSETDSDPNAFIREVYGRG